MRRWLVVLGILLVAFCTLAYLRPAMLLFALRDVQLRWLGFGGRDGRVGEARIAYIVGGKGSQLVMLRWLAMRAKDGSPLLADLTKGHRVYALDLLGSGDSDRPANAEYSVREQTAILHGFLDAMSLRQADVMGISMGG